MAKNQNWQDDYWLLVMQLYLRKPVGVKPMYSRDAIFLCMELHIAPEQLFARQCEIAHLETPRIERIWEEYGRNPKRLTRAVSLLRNMIGFNSSGDFFDGVETCDPYLRRRDVIVHPLLAACQQIWERYGNMDTRQLASYALQLKAYYA